MSSPFVSRRRLIGALGLIGVSSVAVACASSPAAPTPAPAKPTSLPPTAAPAKPTAAPATAATVKPTTAPAVPTTEAATPAARPTAATSTSALQPASLLVWDQFTGGGAHDVSIKIYQDFMSKNPTVKVTQESHGSDLKEVAKTALASGTGPDLVYYDTGPGNAGVFISAGLIKSLDDYSKQFGWSTKIFKWALDRTTFNGHLYGLGLELEYIGMFYNATLSTKTGLKPPQTDKEFLDLATAAKGKSLIADSYSDQPGWQAFHQFGMVSNNAIGSDAMAKLLFQNQGKWTDPAIVDAVKFFFIDLAKAGAFVPNLTAISYNDANSYFYSEKALTDSTGTWLISDITKNVKSDTIQMQPFPAIHDKPRTLPAGLGSAWWMSSKTKAPDADAAFLDFLFTAPAVKLWVEGAGFIPPVAFDPTTMTISPLFSSDISTIESAIQGKGSVTLGYYIDTSAPAGFNQMMQDGFQAVLTGRKTPQQQMTDLQQEWDKGKSWETGL